MEFLSQYGLFLLKSITIVIAILVILTSIASMRRKAPHGPEITSLNEEYEQLKKSLGQHILGKKIKSEKKKDKTKKKALFLLEFNGDIKASQVEQLRDEITAVLAVAKPEDEVVVKIESPGGSVNGYGLAAAQLQRIRDAKIPLTASIDKVAASGGYLMACVADKIIAAPFAILGSIGVVAQIPNFHRWLNQHKIDVELMTAGEYKRTLTLFGENTEKGRKKFQEDLEKIHEAFRNYVLSNRGQINIDEVATGEHWLAIDALALKLVDKLMTSDQYVLESMEKHRVYKIRIKAKQSISEKLLKPAMRLLHPWA